MKQAFVIVLAVGLLVGGAQGVALAQNAGATASQSRPIRPMRIGRWIPRSRAGCTRARKPS
jgi:hypothetical protein